MQGHVLSPTTRQEIHLITCEAENWVWGPDRGGLCSPSSLPETGEGEKGREGETTAVGKRVGADTVKRARAGSKQDGGYF